jgi:hypothetical protein
LRTKTKISAETIAATIAPGRATHRFASLFAESSVISIARATRRAFVGDGGGTIAEDSSPQSAVPPPEAELPGRARSTMKLGFTRGGDGLSRGDETRCIIPRVEPNVLAGVSQF